MATSQEIYDLLLTTKQDLKQIAATNREDHKEIFGRINKLEVSKALRNGEAAAEARIHRRAGNGKPYEHKRSSDVWRWMEWLFIAALGAMAGEHVLQFIKEMLTVP